MIIINWGNMLAASFLSCWSMITVIVCCCFVVVFLYYIFDICCVVICIVCIIVFVCNWTRLAPQNIVYFATGSVWTHLTFIYCSTVFVVLSHCLKGLLRLGQMLGDGKKVMLNLRLQSVVGSNVGWWWKS